MNNRPSVLLQFYCSTLKFSYEEKLILKRLDCTYLLYLHSLHLSLADVRIVPLSLSCDAWVTPLTILFVPPFCNPWSVILFQSWIDVLLEFMPVSYFINILTRLLSEKQEINWFLRWDNIFSKVYFLTFIHLT